jgi:hypothetical protein
MGKKQISVMLDAEQSAFVKRRADVEDRSESSVIRRCVEQERVAREAVRAQPDEQAEPPWAAA